LQQLHCVHVQLAHLQQAQGFSLQMEMFILLLQMSDGGCRRVQVEVSPRVKVKRRHVRAWRIDLATMGRFILHA